MNELAYKHLYYKFNNQDLFLQALTHGSWVNENHNGLGKNYQVLEFLGDSVLKLIQATILSEKFPDWSEGQLTQVRASYENNEILATWTHQLGIDHLIRYGKSINQKSNAWKQICAQVFEAVLGAIWIDCNHDFGLILDLYQRWGLQANEEKAVDNPKKELQELLQSKGYRLPTYSLIKQAGSNHLPVFTIQCSVADLNQTTLGEGQSKKDATKKAAEKMLIKLKNI